jgi:outer membrane protein assembly factor BamB
MPRLLLSLALALTLALTLTAADWPTFRGADRTDVSKETGLLAKWPENGPPVAWKATGLGVGFSSVAVMGDSVYTLGDVDKDCKLFAIDRKTGEKKWELKVGPAGGGGGYIGPRCTPSTDGTHVYALGFAGDLVCATTAGKVVWQKNFAKDFKGRAGGWSYSESPLIDGDRLIATPGGAKAAVVAFDKKTGNVEWSGAIPDGDDAAGYSSVVIGNHGGVKQYITLMANGLVSFDAKTGKMLWRYGKGGDRFGGNTANIPTPIVKDDYVFASAGYRQGGGALLKVTKSGAEFAVEEVYWNPELKNKHGGVLLAGDKLYGDRDDSGNPWCADFLTGRVLWSRKGGEGRGSASMTYADGKLYIRYSDGWVALADATADKYTLLSEFKVPNGKNNTWAHPVVSGGKLYIRELDTLYCHDIAAK